MKTKTTKPPSAVETKDLREYEEALRGTSLSFVALIRTNPELREALLERVK